MTSASNFQPIVAYETVTVASGGTTSGALDLHGCTPVGFFLPSTFDGTTIKLTASTTIDGTYVAVQDGAASPADITYTTSAASKYVAVTNPDALLGLRFIKVVLGTQTTTDTIVTVAVRPL